MGAGYAWRYLTTRVIQFTFPKSVREIRVRPPRNPANPGLVDAIQEGGCDGLEADKSALALGGLLEEAGVDGADGVEAVEIIAAELAEALVVRQANEVTDSVGNLVGRPWTHFGSTRKWHGTCPPLCDVVRDSGRHPTCWSRRGRSFLYKRSVRSEGSFSQKCGGTGQAAAMSAETLRNSSWAFE